MEFKSLNGRPDSRNGRPDSRADAQIDPGPGRVGPETSFHPRDESPALRSAALWAAFFILVIAMAGVAALGWERFDQQEAALEGVVATERVAALEAEIRSFDERLSTLAGRVASSDVVDGLAAKISQVEESLGQEIALTQAEIAALEASVAESGAELPWRIDLGVEDRTSAIRERVGELEASIRDREAQVGGLVAGLGAGIDGLRQEMRLGLTDLERRGDMIDRGFENRVANAERRLDIVAYAVDRERLDFEMFSDYPDELSPGIWLYLSDIDRGAQKISGWVHLVPEGRVVRISEHPIQQSFMFYTHQDERAHELVFTRVTGTAAVGYLRVPPESFVRSADADWTEPSVALAAQ